MAKAESVEALLNPSLRVSRPVAACSRCRAAKIKCDGKLPACSACERVDKTKECSSANDDFAKGKERSYVAALETTIQRLQKRLKEQRSHRDPESSHRLADAAAYINGKPVVHRPPVSGRTRKEASDVDELVSDFGFLTVNATSRDFRGFTSTTSFASLLMAAAVKKPVPHTDNHHLPPRETINPLVEHYFAHLYVLLPFFSETSLVSSINKVYQEPPTLTAATPLDHWYVRLVVAISSASLCRAHGDDHYARAIRHISAAMSLTEHVIHPGSISGLQALLLLVQYSMSDPEHFDSWYLIGMAARLLVDLGLHCEPAPEVKLSKHALDLRRRVFYCTYAFDRYISTGLSLAFSFTDDSAPNVLLPTLATDLERRSPTQLFLRSVLPSLYLFDVRRVQSSFYQETRFSTRQETALSVATEYVSSTLSDIHGWHGSLPASFESNQLHVFFYLEYLYSQLLVLAPCQTVPIHNVTDHNKLLFFQLACQYAEQLELVLKTDGGLSLTYFDTHRARWVGKQFQIVLWSSLNMLLDPPQHVIRGDPLPSPSASEGTVQAINFITRTNYILDHARVRWGLADLRDKFQQESAVLLARLQSKQAESSRDGRAMMGGPHAVDAVSSTPFPMAAPSQDQAMFFQQQQQQQQMQVYSTDQLPPGVVGTPASQRSNLLRVTQDQDQQISYDFPSASQPRRSYEFLGKDLSG